MTAPNPLYQEGYSMTDTTDQQAVTVAQEADVERAELLLRGAVIDRDPTGASLRKHDLFGEVDVGAAIDAILSALASVSSASAEGSWKTAVIDGLMCAHALKAEHENDARKALHDLIAWEVSVALDPRVSAKAAALLAASPEPVPATNQAGEVERPVAYGSGLMGGHLKAGGSGNAIELSCSAAFATQPATSQPEETWMNDPLSLDAGLPEMSQEAMALIYAMAEYSPHVMQAQHGKTVCDDYARAAIIAATPTPPTLSDDLRALGQAIGAEIERQCSIGAGTCGTADDGSGLFEVNASLDLNGFAQAMSGAALAQVKAS